MRLLDQFHAGGKPDLRPYRTLLDAVAACENLPIALITKDRDIGYIGVSSFSAPVFELLRYRNWFCNYERNLIFAGLKESTPGRADPVKIAYENCFEGDVVSYLLPTSDADSFIMCGPVWLRHPQTLREPFTEEFVDRAAQLIIKADSAHEASSPERQLSLERIRRALQHRAAITHRDLEQRVKVVAQTLDCMMNGSAPKRLNADQIERIAAALCFWARRWKHLDPKPLGCPLLRNTESGEQSDLMFELRRSSDNENPLAFTVKHIGNSEVDGTLFLNRPTSEKWSLFSDAYRSNRNVYFLERILLIRLWLQDNFSGIAADDELGGDKSRVLLEHLMALLQSILGADACCLYRYTPGETASGPAGADDRSGYLQRLAFHYAPDTTLEKASEAEADNMRMIGACDEKRAQSIAYQALDLKKTIYEPDVSLDSRADSNGMDVPRTILVTPLVSRGCAWGVIEIIGASPYQFPFSNIRWVEELTRILTPILFDHWLTFRLREISRVAMATTGTSDQSKYELVLDHVRKLMMASSARLFLQHPTQTTQFVMKAHVGQAWTEESPDFFDLENDASESARTINSAEVWSTGKLGEGNFNEQDEGQGPLQRRGHRGCAIIPIYRGSNNCFATLMVTSTDNEFQKSMWDGTVAAVSKTLNVVLEAIHFQETRVKARQTYFAHTIKTRADRVAMGGQRLISLLEPLIARPDLTSHIHRFTNEVESLKSFASRHGGRTLAPESEDIIQALRNTFPPPTSDQARRGNDLFEIVNDLRDHLSEIRKSVVVIAGGRNQEDPREADPQTWDGTWADLRLSLLQSLKPYEGGGYKTYMRVPDRSILPVGMKVRLPSHMLIEILNNLVDNALKYDFSPPSSRLHAIADPAHHRVTLEFRNLAPRVPAEEISKLQAFDGHRSRYAKDKNRDGSGVGLMFIKDLTADWKVGFSYDVPGLDGDKPLGWHSLKLEFNVSKDISAQY